MKPKGHRAYCKCFTCKRQRAKQWSARTLAARARSRYGVGQHIQSQRAKRKATLARRTAREGADYLQRLAAYQAAARGSTWVVFRRADGTYGASGPFDLAGRTTARDYSESARAGRALQRATALGHVAVLHRKGIAFERPVDDDE